MITENLSTLKIHKLTEAQYQRELEAGRIDESALYLTPDEEIDLSGYATVEQLNAKASKSQGVYYIEGTKGTYEEDWIGTHEDITEYYPGLVIAYKTADSGGSGVDPTRLSINSLGFVDVVANNNTNIYKRYPIGSVLLLVYTIDNGTAYWKLYDNDTKGYSSKTLIWTNASPTGKFNTQKISLNLNTYDAVEIIYAPELTNYCLMTSGEIPMISGKTSYARLWSGTPSNTGFMSINSLAEVIYSGITFTPSSNDCSVPYKIYGIKYASN